VEAFARNHEIPIEWAQKGVRKEEYVRRWQRSMQRNGRFGVYFDLQEHGAARDAHGIAGEVEALCIEALAELGDGTPRQIRHRLEAAADKTEPG